MIPARSPNSNNTSRLLSNYVRMGGSFVISMVVVRLLLEFGSDVYATVALLGAGTGISAMLEECVHASVTPTLARAYHSGCRQRFQQTYSTAVVVCLFGSLLTAVAFGLLAWCLPVLKIPEQIQHAAFWFVTAKAMQTFVVVMFAPLFDMYLVTERTVAYNCWLLLERLIDLVVGLMLLLPIGVIGAPTAILVYGIGTATLRIGSVICAGWNISRREPDLRCHLAMVSWPSIRELLKAIWGNSIVVLAMALYVRLDMILLNLAYGLFSNLIFSLAAQVTAYVRILTTGITTGLDVISAQTSLAQKKSNISISALVNLTTKLHGLVVFPTSLVLFVVADPLIRLWIGTRLDANPQAVEQVVLMVRILLIGVTARSLSEGWMRILAGRGEVNRYSVILLRAAILNPLVLLPFLCFLSEKQGIIAAGVILSLLQLIVHQWRLPAVVAKSTGMPLPRVWAPLVRPLLAALLPAPLLAGAVFLGGGAIVAPLLAIGLYLLTFSALVIALVLSSAQRQWLLSLLHLHLFTPRHLFLKTVGASQSVLPQIAANGSLPPHGEQSREGRHVSQEVAEQSVFRSSIRGGGRHLALDVLSSVSRFQAWPAGPSVQVLLLHMIRPGEEEPFRRLLASLVERYTFIGYSEAVRRIQDGKIDRSYLTFTFDDGLKSCLTAASIMAEFQAQGCFFVCPPMLSQKKDVAEVAQFCRDRLLLPSADFLTWTDAERLIDAGHEIGSHTMAHPVLKGLSQEKLRFELEASRTSLLTRLGQGHHFAWPYGRFVQVEEATFHAVFEAGYDSCASAERGCHAPHRETCAQQICLHRDSCEARWPLAHTMYFMRRAAKRPIFPQESWPTHYSDCFARPMEYGVKNNGIPSAA